MKTRSVTRPAAEPDDAPATLDPADLDAVMKAHPVVVTAITRVADRARSAEAARDKALVDLGAERREHANTKAKLDVAESALGKYAKAFGGQPPVPPTARPNVPQVPVISDEEALAKFAAMSPNEKALLMMKATPAAWLTPGGLTPATSATRQ